MTDKTDTHTSPVKLIDIAEIKVDEEFRDQLPSLSLEEYGILRADIKREKNIREAIILWAGKGIIVDGHNRFKIAGELKLKQVPVREMPFSDKEDVKIWIAKNQAGRRNLTGFQRAEAALRLKDVIAAQAKKNQKASGGAVRQKSAKPVNTREEVAKIAGISHTTLSQVEYILEHAGDEQKDSLRKGKESTNKVYTELKRGEKDAAKSTGDTATHQQGGKKEQAAAPASRSKEGQTLEKQVAAYLNRIDDLEKNFPQEDARKSIVAQVKKWLEKKKNSSSAQ